MVNAQNTRATNENLAKIVFSLGIDVYVQLNPSAQGVVPGRLMATTIEAIIGTLVDLEQVRGMLRLVPRLYTCCKC
jgi:dsRNA-specific ribonuclease